MASNEHLKAYQQNAGGTQGYSSGPQPGSPTYTEAWALIESARRMAATIQDGIGDDPAQRRQIRDALRLNWRLWTIFQSELTIAENNPVPEDIRINMLTLCKFVDQHTVDTMANPTAEKIAALIDMNRNIASGLLESLKAGTTAAANQAPDKGTASAAQPLPESKSEEPQAATQLSGIDHEV